MIEIVRDVSAPLPSPPGSSQGRLERPNPPAVIGGQAPSVRPTGAGRVLPLCQTARATPSRRAVCSMLSESAILAMLCQSAI
ncbi:hypothetical protein BO70DRAFT_362950 [Aspergillus heteromorphus CBS 117.55]|uniref:Uncharacterized protein n=1 Tax=Aspergillus heteromorphus CBS 117.55 TaxID=1448321 RepID=A0A317VXV0_9EURO|nr:uncharacterized protein BO70DRAFT_362950 [Aspergillus heteromorphus CBS 117.55]PWY79184.1 hypothetical protein BO70DRAFT_362950 [Aspergillus heteromorphus CBS 117.55]